MRPIIRKTNIWFLTGTAILCCVLAPTLLYMHRSHRENLPDSRVTTLKAPSAHIGAQTQTYVTLPQDTETSAVVPSTTNQQPSHPTTVPVSRATIASVAHALSTVTLGREEIVATVNGKAIMGKDVLDVAFADNSAQVSVSREQYNYLLTRAIERQLIFDEAHRVGISLSPEDLEQLDKLHESRQHDAAVIDPIGDQETIQRAEEVEAEAQLLEKRLLQAKGIPLPYVTQEMVQNYYEQHKDQYGPLPQDPIGQEDAWQGIDLAIRTELSKTAQRIYQQERAQFMNALRTKGTVEIASTASG